MTLPVLRRFVHPAALRELWQRASDAPPNRRACPACRQAMVEVTADDAPPVDVCRRCHFVWFDAGELRQLQASAGPPPLVPPETPAPPPSRATRSGGVFSRPGETRPSDDGVFGLRLLPAYLGMPVELRGAELQSRPWGTWLLAAVVTLTSALALFETRWIDRFALIPAELWRNAGLTMLTTFFLHGGVVHLAGNLYFLVVFGDNVEEYLGRKRWAVLLLGATLAGSLLHTLADVRSHVPCVGASGGISGLIAFYALRFPRARLGSVLWFFLFPYWITYPAWGGFVFWVLAQALLAWQQLLGVGNVSALAHAGGALAGVLAWWCWRDR